jgi:hypothetical protein
MANTLPSIYSEHFDIEEEILELAKNYFVTEEDEEIDISTLKTSLLGYFSAVAGKVVSSGVWHRNTLLDESFINTAKFDSSIYEFAKQYNIEIENATPAKMNITIGIRETDIVNYSIIDEDGTSLLFLIDKLSEFTLDDGTSYKLPNSVIIKTKTERTVSGRSVYSHSIYYDIEDYILSNLSVTNSQIKSWKTTLNEESWIIFQTDVYQVNYETYEYENFSYDSNKLISYEINFNEQLAGFRVFEKKRTDTDFAEIVNREFNAIVPPDLGEGIPYFYYNYPEPSAINVYFGRAPEYRPSMGSKIRLDIYNTVGNAGNFNYSGVMTAKIITPAYLTQLGSRDQSNIRILTSILSESQNGKDIITPVEIKQEVIRKLLSRNNLITESDLNYFFQSLVTLDIPTDSRILFVKKRDDVLRRLFNAFLLLRDDDGRIVPSNTVDLNLTFNQLEDRNFSIKPGTLLVYDDLNRNYRLLENPESPESYINSPLNNFMYSVPYLVKVNFEPYPRLVFYSNSIEEDIPLKMIVTPNAEFDIIMNSLSIERNNIYNNTYEIRTTILTNIDEIFTEFNYPDPPIDETGKQLEYKDFLKYILIARNYDINQGQEGSLLFALELQKDINVTEGNQYFAEINTEDIIDENNKMEVTADFLKMFSLGKIPENISLEVGVVYCLENEDEIEVSDLKVYNSNLSSLFNDYKVVLDDDGSNYRYITIFKPEADYTSLFKSLNSIVCSDLLLNTNGSCIIKDLGCIGSLYYSDVESSNKVNKQLRQFEQILLENIRDYKLLENSTEVSIKFFNTFGISKYYNTTSTNIFLDLKIRLNSALTTDLDTAIKELLISEIESANETTILSFSSVISNLLSTFPQIIHVNLIGINQLGQQLIERTLPIDIIDLTNEQLKRYIPEYLNVNFESSNGQLIPSINIEYY